MAVIAQTIGLKDPSGEALIDWLKQLNIKINLPSNLGALQVNASHIEKLADLAIKDPCHGSNERPVTRDDFVQIYKKAIAGA